MGLWSEDVECRSHLHWSQDDLFEFDYEITKYYPTHIMAPVLARRSPEPPSNIAQLGMGWNIGTGTIDLGLGIFDALIMVGEWIREYTQKKLLRKKAEDIIRRGKRTQEGQTKQKLRSRTFQIITNADHDA